MLERDGETLIKPFCPPYFRNMEEAVLAHQAHHLDPDLYDRYYSSGALAGPQRSAHQHGERA